MKKLRKGADEEIANLDPEVLHAALKQGIAPAMTADITKTFWARSQAARTMRMPKHFVDANQKERSARQ